MKFMLVLLLALITIPPVFAQQGTFVDEIKFIQYLDENTALEEVRNGNLDLYYFRIPSDRLETKESQTGLNIFESTGGSYSLLINPAKSDVFNPFSFQENRFALNYLIDRKLIVNELMGGFGTEMISNYGPFDPDYLNILDTLESYNFKYDPALANRLITNSLIENGAYKNNDIWYYDDSPIAIKMFIRSDDPVRKSIGELLSTELETLGFTVTKDFGDLNKAFVLVYGSDPANLNWHIYTEGWGGRSALVKYDSAGLAQMYSPWFSNMPGFNDPTYWNYQNELLDEVTKKIYTGDFSSSQQRSDLVKMATSEGIDESVRIFIAAKIDQYVSNNSTTGVVNDLGAGVPSRFTPINAKNNSEQLAIGVKQIYQGSWNPIMGFSDSYSTHIWNILYDPGIFKHPFSGKSFPIRTSWNIVTNGPDGSVPVPNDAIIWNSDSKKWLHVDSDVTAISKITYDLNLGNWHHGQPIDMNDVLYSLYFLQEWGSLNQENDKTFDSEFSPQAAQTSETLVGIKPINDSTIEIYVNYWHFDESEIASWIGIWPSMPWEIIWAMEQSVLDGKLSFSRSGAISKNINWLSLLIPHDSMMVLSYLENASSDLPLPLSNSILSSSYLQSRYDSSTKWIMQNNHAVISNGPFMLDNYSPASRTISVAAFSNDNYPFDAGHWSNFENANFPKILKTDIPETLQINSSLKFSVMTENTDKLYYFISGQNGMITSGIHTVSGKNSIITIPQKSLSQLLPGAYSLKIFATSDDVLRPFMFETSFLSSHNSSQLPEIGVSIEQDFDDGKIDYLLPLLVFVISVTILLLFLKKRSRVLNQ